MSSSSFSSSATETLTLIPGLPNDISSLILSLIPFSHHARLKSTSKSWQSFLSSHQPFLVHRSIRTHGPHHPTLLCIFPQDPSLTPPYLFDPSRLTWTPLPLLPCSPHRYGLSNFLSVSLGPHLYVLGGSLFDARSFPIDRPCPSSAVYRLDLPSSSPFSSWARLPSMLSPRGSFACAADPTSNSIVVAGGGSRHTLFRAAGSRLRSVERYDIEKDEWVPEEGLPSNRAGCVGFLVGEEFWVMGGYGACRMVSGVFPVDEHYRDAVALNLKTGKWREIGDMWVDGEGRRRLGTVALVDRVIGEMPWIFMLDGSTIFKYDITTNQWSKESSLPRKAPGDISCGFVALGGELYVMFALRFDMKARRPQAERMTLFIQVYNPKKKTWRCLTTKLPLSLCVDFHTAVMCSIRL